MLNRSKNTVETITGLVALFGLTAGLPLLVMGQILLILQVGPGTGSIV